MAGRNLTRWLVYAQLLGAVVCYAWVRTPMEDVLRRQLRHLISNGSANVCCQALEGFAMLMFLPLAVAWIGVVGMQRRLDPYEAVAAVCCAGLWGFTFCTAF